MGEANIPMLCLQPRHDLIMVPSSSRMSTGEVGFEMFLHWTIIFGAKEAERFQTPFRSIPLSPRPPTLVSSILTDASICLTDSSYLFPSSTKLSDPDGGGVQMHLFSSFWFISQQSKAWTGIL